MADLNIQSVIFVVLTGLVPSLIWLLFWLRRDRKRPEPSGLLTLCFVLGAIGVFLAVPLQKLIQTMFANKDIQTVLWAGAEEIIKFLPAYILALKSKYNDEAIDPAIYMITSALGFAALENVAYALQPTNLQNITTALLSGSLRFFGATLLHAVSSGFVGIVLGLAPRFTSWFFGIFGLAIATFLHSTFNFFIMKDSSGNFLKVYGFLWLSAVIITLTLEKLRRMPPKKEFSPI